MLAALAAFVSSDETLSEHSINDEYLQVVKCKHLTYVVKQCDLGPSRLPFLFNGAVSKPASFRSKNRKVNSRGLR